MHLPVTLAILLGGLPEVPVPRTWQDRARELPVDGQHRDD